MRASHTLRLIWYEAINTFTRLPDERPIISELAAISSLLSKPALPMKSQQFAGTKSDFGKVTF